MLLSDILSLKRNKLFAIIVLAGLVGGCGFRPLYGQHEGSSVVAEQQLALVQIGQIADRAGQQLRNNLLSRLNPKGAPRDPQYFLSISIIQSITNSGVKKSAVVTRGNLRVTASYTLTLLHGTVIDTNSPDSNDRITLLTNGRVLSISSYDISQAQFAANIALKDARTRAIKEIADDIRIRLAVYFKQNPQI